MKNDDVICKCGHARAFHAEEPPYACFHTDCEGGPDWEYFDCDCEGFTIAENAVQDTKRS